MITRMTYAGVSRIFLKLCLGLLPALVAAPWANQVHAATNVPVSGEVQRITVDNPNDHWSGGTIVVGGMVVTIPRNLLMDLPANRVTLQQLFVEAPAACVALGETGLAKGDICNLSGMGGIATIAANRTNAGNIIAGDVFLAKGIEAVSGTVTYINYDQGYYRLNGNPGDPTTGVMVRLNDPDARHSVQSGPGCDGGPNCSPDPRFLLDKDNYTNVFSTGFPYCIPSTVPRTITIGLPSLPGIPGLAVGAVAQASADGSGDVLCPLTNRTVNGGQPVDDSRRFAPIMLGDTLTAEGNFEKVAGVRFLSAHSSAIGKALSTKPDPSQPDYLFLDEVEVDAPGFQNQRVRTLIIGYATQAPADIMIWSIHYDPTTNSPHEFPLASVVGCDIAGGPGTCSNQGLVGAGANIFKIRHDIDFLVGAKPRLNPCTHLQADPRFGALGVCPNGGGGDTATQAVLADQFGIMSPIMHEIQARTGHKVANPDMVTVDVSGNESTNGQYLFPFGMGLGGISTPEMNEINLDAMGTPFFFSGIPWNLDRRLSPGGCIDTTGDGIPDCEATPQPLDPFPYEGVDPRLQASVPFGPYTDPNYTATPLSSTRNRVMAFVNGSLSRLNGNGSGVPGQPPVPASGNFSSTLLAWPPADPPFQPIPVTPEVDLFVSNAAANTAPVAAPDSATTDNRTAVTIAVLANDTDADGNQLSVTTISAMNPAGAGTAIRTINNTVTFTPAASFVGTATFIYGVADNAGGTAQGTVTVTVTQAPNRAPVATADTAVTGPNTPVTINVLANDSDADGDPLTVSAVTQSTRGTVVNNGTSVTFTPATAATGAATFTYTVSDGRGGLSTAGVTVNIQAADTLATTQVEYRQGNREWRISGLGSVNGATITVHVGTTLTGPVIGTATVSAGRWSLRRTNSPVIPDATRTISLESSAGGTRLAIPISVVN